MTEHRYSITPKDANAHLFEVRLTVQDPDPAGQKFVIPAWIPGSYMVRDFARNVVTARAEADGLEVALKKTDKSTWVAAPVARPLTLILEIYGYEPGVRGVHLDATHAYFNGACVFPAVAGQEQSPCVLDIRPASDGTGADWRVATSLRPAGADRYAYGRYRASDYAELIDHPVEIAELSIAEFEAKGIPHTVAIRGKTACDMARLCHDLQVLCETQLSFLGVPADLDRYLFLLHATPSGYGGLEHRWSCSLVCARENLPQKGQDKVDDAYCTFLGLASHEYFHLWNVKRIRPAVFVNSDLSGEAYTELLWVFEGITSYYDDLMLRRSGLITEDQYLKLCGRTITRVLRGAGRKRQSVAASSYDAWIKFYKPDANSGNAVVSYYAKGALIALCLDLRIRLDTDGRLSLDDVMQECWTRFGNNEQGMPERGFEVLCAEVTGLDLGDFFDAAIRGVGELPLDSLLRQHGVNLHLRAACGRDDKGGEAGETAGVPQLTIGASLAERDGKSVFSAVDNGGPAERAGVAPGDIAVALDGIVLSASNLQARLKHCRAGQKLPLLVFRGDEILALTLTPALAPEDTCYLLPASDVPALKQLLEIGNAQPIS